MRALKLHWGVIIQDVNSFEFVTFGSFLYTKHQPIRCYLHLRRGCCLALSSICTYHSQAYVDQGCKGLLSTEAWVFDLFVCSERHDVAEPRYSKPEGAIFMWRRGGNQRWTNVLITFVEHLPIYIAHDACSTTSLLIEIAARSYLQVPQPPR